MNYKVRKSSQHYESHKLNMKYKHLRNVKEKVYESDSDKKRMSFTHTLLLIKKLRREAKYNQQLL